MAGELSIAGRTGSACTSRSLRDGQHAARDRRPRRGDQPISRRARPVLGMQNGEIYNYVELRSELEELGHGFRDVGHGGDRPCLRGVGGGLLQRLNGDFALAIWDRERRELSRAGPLRGETALRPSSRAAISASPPRPRRCCAIPGARRELDPVGLVDIFTLWSTLPDRSAFDGIGSSRPPTPHRGRRRRAATERRWWELDFAPEPARSEDDSSTSCTSCSTDAIRIGCAPTSPSPPTSAAGSTLPWSLAALASHGDDASAFGVASATRIRREPRSRSDRASLGVEFHRTACRARRSRTRSPRVVELAEKPFLRTAPAPFSTCRRGPGAGLKVVLTGEGADEVFAGYDIFREDKFRRFWARHPE